MANYGVRTIRIIDEMFLLNRKYYVPLCNLLKERGYGELGGGGEQSGGCRGELDESCAVLGVKHARAQRCRARSPAYAGCSASIRSTIAWQA